MLEAVWTWVYFFLMSTFTVSSTPVIFFSSSTNLENSSVVIGLSILTIADIELFISNTTQAQRD